MTASVVDTRTHTHTHILYLPSVIGADLCLTAHLGGYAGTSEIVLFLKTGYMMYLTVT